MKLKLLILCAAFALCATAQAQISEQRITLDLSVNQLLPQYIRDWAASDDNAVLTISNETRDVISARVDVQIRIGDTIYARARLFSMPVFQIVPGITTYTAGQIFSTAELEFYTRNQENTALNTPLAANSYTLCLQLIEETGSKPLSLPICRPFAITGAVRPVLLYPARIVDLAFTSDETMSFRWELPYAISPPPAQWTLRIVEANTGGDDSTEFITGRVVLERIVRDSTRFVLRAPSNLFAAGSRYLWSVQPEQRISGASANNTSQGVIASAWAVPMPFTVMQAGKK